MRITTIMTKQLMTFKEKKQAAKDQASMTLGQKLATALIVFLGSALITYDIVLTANLLSIK